MESKAVRTCCVNLSNQLNARKHRFFYLRRGKILSKTDYVRALSKELIKNDEWVVEKNAMNESSKKSTRKCRRRMKKHELSHLQTVRSKLNGSEFRRTSQPY